MQYTMYYKRKFNIFGETSLAEYLNEKYREIDKYIDKESDNYILNVNEEEFINYIVEEVKIDPLQIEFDKLNMDHGEVMIPAEKHPSSYFVCPSKSYPRQCFRFYLPFSGDPKLLECTPSTFILWTKTIYIDGQEIYFEIIQFSETGEQIRREALNIVESIKSQLENVNKEVENFNTNLYNRVKNKFLARKNKIIETRKLITQINIPVKKKENVPETFAVSTPKMRKKIVTKPVATEDANIPNPTLDDKTYKEILKTINDIGKQFERLPSLYKDKKEEHLRDHILMILEPNFQGSATGETFNKNGKTDILLRYDSSNIFIAECKFWKGQKAYLSTISQLLSYLTWRDSKAAVIIFVKNKDFSSVIEAVKENTPKHENYLDYVDSNDETWFNYRFHINGDKNREVKLAIMLYHIPSISDTTI